MFEALAFLPFIATTITTPTAMVETVYQTSVFEVLNSSDIILDAPYTNQKDNLKYTELEWTGGSACGPASLTMAINFLGDTRSLEEVINILPDSVYIKGKMFYNLPLGASILGYKAHSIEIDTTEIYNTLNMGYPVILNVQNYDGRTGHAVLVVGMNGYDGSTAKSLVVHDPFRKAYVEFEYINERTLKQPEGHILAIGILKPFYVTNKQ